MVEYANIIKTDYILRYINSPVLQKHVQKALNRGEGYNKLNKRIFYANDGKFRVHSMQEQQRWMECTRLIANTIIYYNTWLISELLNKKQAEGDVESVERLKRVSPIGWRHIHFYGSYQFAISGLNLDWDEVFSKIEVN